MEKETKPFKVGPEKDFPTFRKIIESLAGKNALVFIKITIEGWVAEVWAHINSKEKDA